VSFPFGFLIVV